MVNIKTLVPPFVIYTLRLDSHKLSPFWGVAHANVSPNNMQALQKECNNKVFFEKN